MTCFKRAVVSRCLHLLSVREDGQSLKSALSRQGQCRLLESSDEELGTALRRYFEGTSRQTIARDECPFTDQRSCPAFAARDRVR